MDEQFIDRVLRASAVAAAVAGLCGWAYWGPQWALAWLLASAWSIVNLWVLAHLLKRLFQRGSRFALVAFFCLKVPVLYGLILCYLLWVPWRPSALIGGIILPYAVIVLKALGRFLVDSMSRKETPSDTGANKTTERIE